MHEVKSSPYVGQIKEENSKQRHCVSSAVLQLYWKLKPAGAARHSLHTDLTPGI